MANNYCKDCKFCVPSFASYSNAASLSEETDFICTKSCLHTNPFTTDYNAGCREIHGFEARESNELSEVEKLAYDIVFSNNTKQEKTDNYKRYKALGLKTCNDDEEG